jgi:hypothetical protein
MERERLPKPDILQIDEAASSPHSFVVDEEENVRGNSTTLVAGQQT